MHLLSKGVIYKALNTTFARKQLTEKNVIEFENFVLSKYYPQNILTSKQEMWVSFRILLI